MNFSNFPTFSTFFPLISNVFPQIELQDLEQKIKDSRRNDTVEKKRLETIDTFYQSKFLKKVQHMSLITEVRDFASSLKKGFLKAGGKQP